MQRVFYTAVAAMALVLPSTYAVSAQRPTFNTNRQVTFVLRGGERHSGTLVYHNTADFNLIENGQDKAYPASDIAMVDFGAGEPAAAELNQLPAGTPTELQRNMLVLRDGSVIHGKVYTIKENAITIDNASGGRQDVDLGNVSRLYMNAAAARSVFASALGAAPTAAAAAAAAAAPAGAAPPVGAPNRRTGQRQPAGTTGQTLPAGAIQVNANQPWTDAGISVNRGDRVAFSTTGQITIRQNSSAMIGPDGSATENRAGAPVQSIGVGGLIGRIGTGAPFAIGANSQPISMPAAGRLYLGVNDSGVGDNSGAFVVTIVR